MPDEFDACSHIEMRKEIVGFLNEERLDASDLDVFQNVEPSLFVGTDWSQYLNQMGQLKQFGDHITLWAAAQKYDIQIAVISSWGDRYNTIVHANNLNNTASERDRSFAVNKTILLGHLGEDVGAHYVCLSPTATIDDVLSVRFSHITRKTRQNAAVLISRGDMTQETMPLPPKDTCDESITASVAEPKHIPDCWTHNQYMYFKTENPWITVFDKSLGCSACKSAKGLGTKTTQGVQLSREWTDCCIKQHGITIAEQKDSLRKKFTHTELPRRTSEPYKSKKTERLI